MKKIKKLENKKKDKTIKSGLNGREWLNKTEDVLGKDKPGKNIAERIKKEKKNWKNVK